MKKTYNAPEIKAHEYAKFENVYTGGCTKQINGGHLGSGCYYDANINPSTDPSGTNSHKSLIGPGSI